MRLAYHAVNSVYNVNVPKHRHLGPWLTLAFMLATAFPGPAWAQAAGPPAPTPLDSVVYAVEPSSVLQVHAGKSGLLSGLGHEHRVRAHAFSGTVVYFPDEVARSRVSITVLADSLRVVPEADSADIPKITGTMRAKTLRVDSFPEIAFVSREVTLLEGGRVRVTGELTMVGRTRPVSVDLVLEVSADTLRAAGVFVVKQTDFGIKPYKTALGLVKVKDEVRFELRVVAAAVQVAGLLRPGGR